MDAKEKQVSLAGIGLVFGVAFGAIFDDFFGNMTLGISLGAAFGLLFAPVITKEKLEKKKNAPLNLFDC
jgi:hypothetical protein